MLELPSKALFKVGDRRELACRMSSCPEKVKFVWTSLEDKPLFANFHTEDKESVMVFENVSTNHENTIVCRGSCGKDPKQANTAITVYCEFTVCFQFHCKFNRLYNLFRRDIYVIC